ncbi:hypothetical protein, partial [Pseudomonas tolaasii]|uniref:hypothetical protein n=1 Tax=Pseudomonas tolaasii TaxID=29442 RepID=UPI001C430BB3
SEDQSTPAQALGLEDAVRSAYRGERCTYVLNSGFVKPAKIDLTAPQSMQVLQPVPAEKSSRIKAHDLPPIAGINVTFGQ